MRTTRLGSSGPRPHIVSAALMHDSSSGSTIGSRLRREELHFAAKPDDHRQQSSAFGRLVGAAQVPLARESLIERLELRGDPAALFFGARRTVEQPHHQRRPQRERIAELCGHQPQRGINRRPAVLSGRFFSVVKQAAATTRPLASRSGHSKGLPRFVVPRMVPPMCVIPLTESRSSGTIVSSPSSPA